MKIVFVHTDFRLYWGARLHALKQYLEARGHSLDVIEIADAGSHYAFSKENHEGASHWHVVFPGAKPEALSGKEIQPRLFALLEELRPDVIIAGAIAFPSGALSVAWGQKNQVPVVVFDDARIEAVLRGKLVTRIKQGVYRGVSAMFYPAPAWKETGAYWGFKEEQLFYGVDVVDNDFWSRPRPQSELDGNFILAVGRQIELKNFLSIVKAYAIYYQQMGDKAYDLVLIGEGPQHQEIEETIAAHHIEHKVKLLPFKTPEELAGFYQQAQLLVLASIHETWGLVLNEAMAAGCPVAVSRQCGAASTLVQQGVNGYHFDCQDIEEQACCMVAYHHLTDQEKQAMRKQAQGIMQEWGLPRFSQGAFEAAEFAYHHPVKVPIGLDRCIIQFWKGRYNPI